jgi:hypothetical protein
MPLKFKGIEGDLDEIHFQFQGKIRSVFSPLGTKCSYGCGSDDFPAHNYLMTCDLMVAFTFFKGRV